MSSTSVASEKLYCHEIARRSVARAALHLGIDAMSEESLNVLGDVLIAYLGRVGKTLSLLVEASGRPSSHVNVLDTLQAIHMTKSPALQRLQDQSSESVAPSAGTPTSQFSHWQDLAVFCFGPKWNEKAMASRDGSGKVGPSATASDDGWKAPFLEEIPPFPVASAKCANPHRCQPHVGLSLHDSSLKEEEAADTISNQLNKIPDKVFTTWGEMNGQQDQTGQTEDKAQDGNKKRKPDSDSTDEPPVKKTKLDVDELGVPDKKRPSYVPNFFPPFPESKQTFSQISDVPNEAKSTTATKDQPLAVRSSLVDLGQYATYWGSGWDQETTKVPLGRAKESDSQKGPAQTVVPLGRASNSRVSRILEGSMDAALDNK